MIISISCTSEKEKEEQKNANEFNNSMEQTIKENGKPLKELETKICSTCRGTGKIICKKCNGTGSVRKEVLGTPTDEIITCPNCDGYGFFVCDKCGGTGTVKE